MSLSQGLTAAVSGLKASAKGAEVVSANIANLRTEGYRRRDLHLTGMQSGGVAVAGVRRAETPVATADRRIAQAEVASASYLMGYHKRLETAFGLPTDPGALTRRIDAFEAALTEAAAAPENTVRLQKVLDSADAVTSQLRDISNKVQQERSRAEADIQRDVETLNTSLARIAELNTQIRKLGPSKDTASLLDARQSLVDGISEIVSIRELRKGDGGIVLYTTGGQILVDGTASRFGFTPAGVMTHELSQQAGQLSGLTLNGRPVRTFGPDSQLGTGRLSASFDLRDSLAPGVQRDLDAFALSLARRLDQADLTLAPGQAGVLTDAGQKADPTRTDGLASRIALNAVLSGPSGEIWRLRSGIGATQPGPVGDNRQLDAFAHSLSHLAPSALSTGQTARSVGGMAADLVSSLASARLRDEGQMVFSTTRQRSLEQVEAAAAVDSDQEMQRLLQIERAYAANAQVIGTIDRMFDTLLRINP